MSDMRTKGFTLIELIVVIAIIAVLAAILVPSMIGYMHDSKLGTANANAKLVFEHTSIYCTECEVAGTPMSAERTVTDLRGRTASDEGIEYLTDGEHLEEALVILMGSSGRVTGIAISVTNGHGIAQEAKWAKNESDLFIGHYPGEYTEKQAQGILN